MTAILPEKKTAIINVPLKTNLNNKLGCTCICHIMIAGKNGIPESALKINQYRFSTLDNSHPPVVYQLVDSCRQKLKDISPLFTMLSHGMDQPDFIISVLKAKPGTSMDTEIVTYFYRKVEK